MPLFLNGSREVETPPISCLSSSLSKTGWREKANLHQTGSIERIGNKVQRHWATSRKRIGLQSHIVEPSWVMESEQPRLVVGFSVTVLGKLLNSWALVFWRKTEVMTTASSIIIRIKWLWLKYIEQFLRPRVLPDDLLLSSLCSFQSFSF